MLIRCLAVLLNSRLGVQCGFELAAGQVSAIAIRDDLDFFQAVRAVIIKTTESKSQQELEDMDLAIKQIISKVVISDSYRYFCRCRIKET